MQPETTPEPARAEPVGGVREPASYTAALETRARHLAADKMGLINDPEGDRVPAELWRQCLPQARADLPMAPHYEAQDVVNDPRALATFTACEWDELGEDGRLWMTKVIKIAQERALALRDRELRDARAEGAERGEGVVRTVIAISGGLGSGKASLAEALVDHLGAVRVSFGIEVRRALADMGADPTDLDKLQTIGQAFVVNDCSRLIDHVLAQDTGSRDAPLVICGIRHVEVWCELRRRFPNIRLVHIDTPDSVREARLMKRDGIERRLAARFDNALSEVQIDRILPQYAAVRINGSLPIDLQAGYAVTFLGLDRARIAAAPAPTTDGTGGRSDGV